MNLKIGTYTHTQLTDAISGGGLGACKSQLDCLRII